MRRALRRAWLGGWRRQGMGIAGPAVAQAPGRANHPDRAGHVVEQTGQVIVTTEGHARLEEGQVELGLLADPMLFSYGLSAPMSRARTLEVRGFVRTTEERAIQASLKVAREQTSLHVIDKLKIQPNLQRQRHPSSISRKTHPAGRQGVARRRHPCVRTGHGRQVRRPRARVWSSASVASL